MEAMQRISQLYHAQLITRKEAVMLLVLSAPIEDHVTLCEEWLSSDPELLGILEIEQKRDCYIEA